MERRQYRAPRGVRDVLPEEVPAWRRLETTAARLARLRGFREIRPALLEELELFTRSVGEVTDIVQKEMFTLQKGETQLALRPEGTAGIVRAYLEAGYAKTEPVQRLFHVGPMFRYERPQKGRERMFTQFDVEALGSLDPRLDAEIIQLAATFFEELGLTGLELRVNSMGDGDDRERWREAVKAFVAPTLAERCDQCRERFERNVLRVLDCKNPRCKELNAGAPAILAFLGAENRAHFDAVAAALGALGRKVVLDSGIVRGLDYYTRTVFEIHAPALGARSALCGGGRYDHLMRDLGGPDLGAVGFAVGFSSTLALLEALGAVTSDLQEPGPVFLVLNSAGGQYDARDLLEREVFRIAEMLRSDGIACIYDVEARSLKGQMKQAGRGGRQFAVMLGFPRPTDLLDGNGVELKDLTTGEQRQVSREELSATLRSRIGGTASH